MRKQEWFGDIILTWLAEDYDVIGYSAAPYRFQNEFQDTITKTAWLFFLYLSLLSETHTNVQYCLEYGRTGYRIS